MAEHFPGPEVGYTDLIDACLEKNDKGFNAFPLRPSASNKCEKALIYETKEYLGLGKYPKQTMAPEVKRLLDLGYSVEWHSIKNFELISKYSEDFKIKYKQQSIPLFILPAKGPIKHPRVVEGSLDLAVMRKTGGGGFGDVKSTKDKFSQIFKTKWDETIDKLKNMTTVEPLSDKSFKVTAPLPDFLKELNDPYFEDNFVQLNIYCCSRFAKEHSIDHGFIYRYNKNDSRHIDIRFIPHQGMADAFEEKSKRIYEKALEMEESSLASMRCTWPIGGIKYAFCDCHSYSGQDPNKALKSYFATFPKKKWPTEAKKLGVIDKLNQYEMVLKDNQVLVKLEQEICQIMLDKKVDKVKLDNGNIYELKCYKTGGIANGPRTALKRSKL